MRPGNLPPFGRLELNRNLADQGLLPREVERTVRLGKVLPSTDIARSRHLIQWQLSNTDRSRIRDAGGQRASFAKVTLQKYMQPQQLAAVQQVLMLGGQFDCVINLDGFNDIALASREHEATGLHPFYPRRWPRRVSELPNVEAQRLIQEAIGIPISLRCSGSSVSRSLGPTCFW